MNTKRSRAGHIFILSILLLSIAGICHAQFDRRPNGKIGPISCAPNNYNRFRSFILTVNAANTGGTGRQGGINISFPQNPMIKIVHSTMPMPRLFPVGFDMYNFKTRRRVKAQHITAMTWTARPWKSGQTHTVRIRVFPQGRTSVIFNARVQIVGAAGTSHAGTVFNFPPESKYSDQQGIPCKKFIVWADGYDPNAPESPAPTKTLIIETPMMPPTASPSKSVKASPAATVTVTATSEPPSSTPAVPDTITGIPPGNDEKDEEEKDGFRWGGALAAVLLAFFLLGVTYFFARPKSKPVFQKEKVKAPEPEKEPEMESQKAPGREDDRIMQIKDSTHLVPLVAETGGAADGDEGSLVRIGENEFNVYNVSHESPRFIWLPAFDRRFRHYLTLVHVKLQVDYNEKGCDKVGKRLTAALEKAKGLLVPGFIPPGKIMQSDGDIYYTLNVSKAKTMAKMLDHGTLDSETAVGYTIRVCTVLETLHSQEMIHGNLTPENVLIHQDGGIFLINAGMQEEPSDAQFTKEGGLLETPCYWTPEQVTGSERTVRSDVHSVGVLLYRMLTGRCPFRGKSDDEVIRSIKYRRVKPDQNIPDSLYRVVSRCTNKKPKARYHNVSALISDLKGLSH